MTTRIFIAVFALTVFLSSVKAVQLERAGQDTTMLVAADSSGSKMTSLSAGRLQALPFRDESHRYYNLFAGVSSLEFRGRELLHVRGSRHDELGITFEGIDIRSAYDGEPLLRFIPEALAALEIDNAPDAAASNAAALLNHRIATASEEFKVLVQAESDRFTSDHTRRLGTYSYGHRNLLALLQGTLFNRKLNYFAANEYQTFADHYRRFWPGFIYGGDEQPVDHASGQTLHEIMGVSALEVKPGNRAADSERYTLNGKVQFEDGPFKLGLVTLIDRQELERNDTPILYMFNPERIPRQKKNAAAFSLQTDFVAPSQLEMHLQFDLLRSDDKTYDPIFEDNFFLYRDSLAITARGLNWTSPPEVTSGTYLNGPGNFIFNSFQFQRPGQLAARYAKSEEDGLAFSGFAEQEVGAHHWKVGGGFNRRTIRNFRIGSSLGYARLLRQFGQSPENLSPSQQVRLRREGNVRNFGFDLFGNVIEENDVVNDGARHPTHVNAFVQDRLTSENLAITFGLRFDRFTTGEFNFNDPRDPSLELEPNPNVLPSNLTRVGAESFLSPRLAIQYQYNERLSFKLNYGQFVQQVALQNVYSDRQTRTQNLLERTFNIFGNTRGVSAGPVRSKQTSVGGVYRTPIALLKGTIFFKTMEGHLEVERFQTASGAIVSDYPVLANNGSADARGIELQAEIEYRHWRAWGNYTLSNVSGLNSYEVSNFDDLFGEVSGERNKSNKTTLEHNKTHSLTALLSYDSGAKAPPWLRHLRVHTLISFESGHSHSLFEGRPG